MKVKLVTILTAAVSISMATQGVVIGAELTIKQDGLLFETELTKPVYAETFVISPAPKKKIEQIVVTKAEITEQLQEESEVVLTPPNVAFTNPIFVHFKIDSIEISSEEETKMLSQIREFGVAKTTPLTVTGFTCTKGPAEFNSWLSKERAKSVAKLLENYGYTVTKIEGKGDSNLISRHYSPLNRRVEITAVKNDTVHIGQPQNPNKEE